MSWLCFALSLPGKCSQHLQPACFTCQLPVTLLPPYLQCTSKCPAGSPNSVNCAACTATGSCFRCVAGWSKDAAGRCTLNCLALFGTGCNSCSAMSCRSCASGLTLTGARTACARSQRRRLRLLGSWELA